jgi:hypothetical protein
MHKNKTGATPAAPIYFYVNRITLVIFLLPPLIISG